VGFYFRNPLDDGGDGGGGGGGGGGRGYGGRLVVSRRRGQLPVPDQYLQHVVHHLALGHVVSARVHEIVLQKKTTTA